MNEKESIPMTEKSVSSARGTTHYWIAKHGNPRAAALVFLHGLTANHHLFDQQMPFFAREHTVLAWDAPAHGKSRPYQDFTYAHVAAELRQLLDKEAIDQVMLVGQSAGGYAAQSFVRQCPERVAGILMIGSSPYDPSFYSRSDFFWLRQIEWMARLYPDGVLRRSMAKLCGYTPHAQENMLAMLQDYGKVELCRLMALGFAGFIPEVSASLGIEIPCPVWLLVGEQDKTGKVRQFNEQWHRKAGYPLHIIANAAHNANDDQPETVNRLIAAFARMIFGDA